MYETEESDARDELMISSASHTDYSNMMKDKLESHEEKERAAAEITDINFYLITSKGVLDEVISLCGLVSQVNEEEKINGNKEENLDGNDIPLPHYEYSLKEIYEILKPIVESSSFIKQQLYPVFEKGNVSEKSVLLTKFKSGLLDKWRSVDYVPDKWSAVETLPKELSNLPYNEKVLEVVKRAEITAHAPTNKNYFDRDELDNNPLTVEQLCSDNDCKRIFGMRNRNTDDVEMIFGNTKRSMLEHALDEFLVLFVNYIQHPDFEAIGFCQSDRDIKPYYRFSDPDAYIFYFFEMMTKMISVFNKYMVELIDDVYEIIFDGFDKLKMLVEISKAKYSDISTLELYTGVSTRLTVLDQWHKDKVFSSLRVHSNEGSNKKNDEKLRDKFFEIVLGKDRTKSLEQVWKNTINTVKLHHPKVENADELAPLLQVCDAFSYCIEHALETIDDISKLVDREQKYSQFYDAYSKISGDLEKARGYRATNVLVQRALKNQMASVTDSSEEESEIVDSVPKSLKPRMLSMLKFKKSRSSGDLSGEDNQNDDNGTSFTSHQDAARGSRKSKFMNRGNRGEDIKLTDRKSKSREAKSIGAAGKWKKRKEKEKNVLRRRSDVDEFQVICLKIKANSREQSLAASRNGSKNGSRNESRNGSVVVSPRDLKNNNKQRRPASDLVFGSDGTRKSNKK